VIVDNLRSRISRNIWILVLASTLGAGVAHAQSFDLGFEITGVNQGQVVQGQPGELLTFEGYARISTNTPGVRGWAIGFNGSGGNISFNQSVVEDCSLLAADSPCKLAVINSLGSPGITALIFDAPFVVAGNTGVIDGLGFTTGETFPTGTHRMLRFDFSVVVPQLGSPDQQVSLRFVDGLQGPGQPVANNVSVTQFPTFDSSNGVNLGSFNFSLQAIEQVLVETDFEIPGLCGGLLQGTPGQVMEFEGFARLRTLRAGVRGWAVSFSGEGGNIEFDKPTVEDCSLFAGDGPCKLGIINSLGNPGISALIFDAPFVVDPNLSPTMGPLAGMGPQGPGIVDGVAMTTGETFGIGTFRVLKFRFRVTVPSVASGPQLVRLSFKDGIQGPGQAVSNNASIEQFPTLENSRGLRLGDDCTFLLDPQGIPDEPYILGFDINGLNCGDTITGAPGQVLQFDGFATIDADDPGVRAWSLGYGGTGANIEFDGPFTESCSFNAGNGQCKVDLINSNGSSVSNIVFDATTVVDPNFSPTEGPLQGSPQGQGVIDGVVLTIGDSINAGVTRLMRFRFRVTVPQQGTELARLFFLDGLQGGGESVENNLSIAGQPTVTPDNGLFLGGCTFQVRSASGGPDGPFRRGDVDGSSIVDITDAINGLSFLIFGSFSPLCMDAADVDDNGTVDLTDFILELSFLILGTFDIPPPGPNTCGPDSMPDSLDCLVNDGC
jgi:hypothetical protein